MVYLASTPKKLLYFFIALLVLVFLFSSEVQKKPLKLLTMPVGSAVYYLQIASNGLFDGVGKIWDHYLHLVDVQEENTQLRRAIETLQIENTLLKEKGFLAHRLKTILDYKEHSNVDLIAAAVIGRKPSQWFDTLMINKGSSDGIQVDMGVLAPTGVVGKIIDTGPHYAQVLMVSDRNSAIGAIVQRTRDEGIVQGIDDHTLQLKYLPHDTTVAVGDLLVTSGMEGSFTKGLKIGQVKDIERKKGEMFLKITATIGSNLRRVEEVLVIRSIQNETRAVSNEKTQKHQE
ncbi:MAG: rod shape-determining protein MreC [Nitrospiria bacterium]